MSSNLIKIYLDFKKKVLYEYLLQINEIITVSDNTLWKTKKSFTNFAEGIINYYVDSYYFDNNDNRDNPIEYSNDNINSILLALINYCKKTKQTNILIKNKNEVFLLSVMMCAACYLDIAANVIDGDYEEVKNKFRYLLEYLKKVEILNVNDKNDKNIEKLFIMLKNNNEKEFNFFNSIEQPDFYNSYYPFSIDFKYNLVEYNFNLKTSKEFIPSLFQSVVDNRSKELYDLSFSLLELKLLKEYLGNGKVFNYIYKINEQNVDYFNSIDNEIILKHLYILIGEDDIEKYKNKFKRSKLNIIYEFSSLDNIPKKLDGIICINEKLVNNDILKEWNDKKIKFIIKNKEEY